MCESLKVVDEVLDFVSWAFSLFFSINLTDIEVLERLWLYEGEEVCVEP
jgi:hypothetical protein